MTDAEILEILDTYPDRVADAKKEAGTASLVKDMTYAKVYLELKARHAGGGERLTAADLAAMVKSSPVFYESAMSEIVAESKYLRLNERLMCAKKIVAWRTAL